VLIARTFLKPKTTINPPENLLRGVPMNLPGISVTNSDDEDITSFRVTKREGHLQTLNPDKLRKVITRCAVDIPELDLDELLRKTLRGVFDGITTQELYNVLIQNSSMLIGKDPGYSKLAARFLRAKIRDEVKLVGVRSFYESIVYGHEKGILSDEILAFVTDNKKALNRFMDNKDLFEYFGLRTVYDRYLLKDPQSRMVFETPQYFFLRVACGLANTQEEVKEFYDLMSSFEYMPSTPTLFNSGTRRSQMSSCYLLDSPQDSLDGIYDKYKDVALLSKFAGGIGMAFHRIRSHGSLIQGTNGKSNGIIPFLKTLDASVAAVNQGGKRKGAACIYLETWHPDIMDFLQLRENTGDEYRRTHNLNTANWIPDLFMQRVVDNKTWSLFDPKEVPHLIDLYGDEFEAAYEKAEAEGKYINQLPAREIYAAMMKSLAQTGNGWMTFKDASNLKANQVGKDEKNNKNVIHLSNLCTEILEVTCDKETAVCNLGSLNLSKYVTEDLKVDYVKIAETTRKAVKYLDRVIDINFYPIETAKASNNKWRPVGLGIMGIQDLFFKLGLPFDSPEAREVSRKVQEEIYFNALSASVELAKICGPHEGFKDTKAAKGLLQFDLWGVKPAKVEWDSLKEDIKKHGLRNSLLIAIAPTATIASIVGSYEGNEAQLSNLFKRETLSGEFLQINSYLVAALKDLGLWTKSVRDKIKLADGSVQKIEEIPEDIRHLFRTVWEIPQKSLIEMAADRGAYIDQSQSLNLFMENPTIGKLSSMYKYAWKQGLKTTYYLRSRSATKIKKTTVDYKPLEAVTCSLENPDTCESCQ
jgi:ribonucleoside-diphosphate reductase alpha chain